LTLVFIDPSLMLNIPVLLFVFAFGCCAGSFINVLVYRLPRGKSIITPPSACPSCSVRLTWRENFPVLGWLLLGGRCRFCKARISAEYPIVELFVGLLLAGLYVLYYMVPQNSIIAGRGPQWAGENSLSVIHTWPMFAAHALLLASLVAMTLIDARYYIIPLGIPWSITVVGIAANTLQPLLIRRIKPWQGFDDPGTWPLVPTMNWTQLAIVLAGFLGLGIAVLLVETGLMHRSFNDYEEWEEAERKRLAEENPDKDSDTLDSFDMSAYPHARREVIRELLFLAPCMGLMMLAYRLGIHFGWSAKPPVWMMGLGGALAGYLIGGGVVWAVRILGSLAFGKEAMGLGDVHMMAGVGAVLGWVDPVLAFFFAAPFLGLGYSLLMLGPGRLFGSLRKPIPYGPFLAAGVLLVMLAKPEYETLISHLLHTPINLP